ncbi:MAG TPA: RsmE family RNA methyltransferase [Tepidisphaeraceae bacterium]|jgi:16S rRNA (uracil1498-N3)-methyltransferase
MRRLIVNAVTPGLLTLDEEQSHHARNVLRLQNDACVEVFDASGRSAAATVRELSPRVTVHVDSVSEQAQRPLIVASAVPKGDRADWLVEKLSELGVTTWQPLRTARSVVHPDGPSKYERWNRIAVEAAKQSKRVGTMRIEPLAAVSLFVANAPSGQTVLLSTGTGAIALSTAARMTAIDHLLIGPEGGWTPEEEAQFTAAGLTRATLGATILRIETAAIVAAAILCVSRAEVQ